MSRKPSPYDLIVNVPSETSPGTFYQIKRHRETQDLGCSCRSFAVAPTCDVCGHALSRRHLDDRTVFDCEPCRRFDVPRSCKHLREFRQGTGEPAPVAVGRAIVTATDARRRSPRNTASSMTAVLTQPIKLDEPVRVIILPDE